MLAVGDIDTVKVDSLPHIPRSWVHAPKHSIVIIHGTFRASANGGFGSKYLILYCSASCPSLALTQVTEIERGEAI
jgi:hypothetical protein